MVYMGNPNVKTRVVNPPTLRPSLNNGFGTQQVDGATQTQTNTTGVPYSNLNSSGYTTTPQRNGFVTTYNPPVTTQPVPNPTPTTPAAYNKYDPSTWWWRQTPGANGMVNGYNTNAVPMGNFPQPTQGIQTYLNPATGLHQYGPGQGMVAAPAGSGVAYQPQQSPFGNALGGGGNWWDQVRQRRGYGY